MTLNPGLRRFVALLICYVVIGQLTFAGQTVGLRVIVTAGDGLQNVVNEVPPQPLAVRVVDRENRPVQGATVVFAAPASGPGGDFPTGATFSTLTDEDGRAVGVLFRPNEQEGPYSILVR